MAITGQKYSGTLTSASQTTLTDSAVNFNAGDFNDKRIVCLFDANGSYKATAYITRRASANQLDLDYAWFDIRYVDMPEVTASVGDHYKVSLLPNEVTQTGWSADSTTKIVTISNKITFGKATSPRDDDLVLYGEGWTFIHTLDDSPLVSHKGGVILLGRLVDKAGLAVSNPSSWVFTLTSNSRTVYHQATDGVGVYSQFGGRITANANYAYLGHFGGQFGNAFRISGVSCQVEIFDRNLSTLVNSSIRDKMILQNCITEAKNNLQNSVRGQYSVIGGTYMISNPNANAVFNVEAAGTFDIGAPAGQRMVVIDSANATPNDPATLASLHNTYNAPVQTLNWTNVLTTNRKHKKHNWPIQPATYTTGQFWFTGAFTGLRTGTKAVMVRDSDQHVESRVTVGADGTAELKVLQQVVEGFTPTHTYDGWLWELYHYGYVPITAQISTVQTEYGADVQFGGPQVQVSDPLITERDKTVVDSYPITVALAGDTLTITGDNATVQPLTAAQFYDAVAAYVYNADLLASDVLVTRTDNTIDARNLNVTLDYIAFDGSIKTASTAEVVLTNGSTVSGSIVDKNGDSFGTITLPSGYDTISIHTSAADAKTGANALPSIGNTLRWTAAAQGGSLLWVRLTDSTDAGDLIVQDITLPAGAGIYTFNAVAFSENAQLGQISAQLAELKTDVGIARDNARAANWQTQPQP